MTRPLSTYIGLIVSLALLTGYEEVSVKRLRLRSETTTLNRRTHDTWYTDAGMTRRLSVLLPAEACNDLSEISIAVGSRVASFSPADLASSFPPEKDHEGLARITLSQELKQVQTPRFVYGIVPRLSHVVNYRFDLLLLRDLLLAVSMALPFVLWLSWAATRLWWVPFGVAIAGAVALVTASSGSATQLVSFSAFLATASGLVGTLLREKSATQG